MGTVYSFGENAKGQLGINSTTASNIPKKVLDQSGSTPLTGIVYVYAGEYTSFAVRSDGALFSWGNNAEGELGTNDKVTKLLPTQVVGGEQGGAYLTDVKKVVSGKTHTLALLNSGEVFGFGSNNYGKLGRDQATEKEFLAPAKMRSGDMGSDKYVTNASLIGAGLDHSIVVDKTGVTYSLGRNDQGQLGLGYSLNTEDLNSNLPKKVGIGGGMYSTKSQKYVFAKILIY